MVDGGCIQGLKRNMVGVLMALSLFSPVATLAAETPGMQLYRYVDSRGVTVLDRQGVPPEYVAKGYEILNAQGRVIQVVPPARTPEQIRQAEADKAQASADAQLLSLYGSVEDVDRVEARKLAELDGLVGVTQGNIQGLAAQQRNLQSQAADQERAGRPVPQTLIDQLQDVREQQLKLQADIERYQAARAKAKAGFAVDRLRIQQLTH
ncbi:MAG: hypothetical protein K0R45_106 [Pseudomonas sp.]|jgi:hypothetical protein|nr:hypothetical protein [Pseudomonas sp.]